MICSMKFFILLLNVLLINSAAVDESEDAKLLVVKNVLNNFVVEGTDVLVRYNIYNVGNVPALNVKLQDENFPNEKFEYVSGFNVVRWSKISPASNVSHVAVVRPKIVGLFNFTHATVSYSPNEKTSKVQVGYSTELGQVYIQNLREYNRRFASHTVDWLLFAVLASPSILFPFFLWFNSKKKYESVKQSKKDKTN